MTDLPRSIELEGASNLRDLGGYRTKDGAKVRFNRVFRSARLSEITDEDAKRIRAAGIGRVADLRGPGEQAAAPTRLAGVEIHDLSIDPSLGNALRTLSEQGDTARLPIQQLMAEAYAAYALTWNHRYARLFDLLLEPNAPALLFHCTAGKDRTGFGAALILAALGVDRATIQADYLATRRLWRGQAGVSTSLTPIAAEVLTSVEPMFLDAAFAAMMDTHGSLDGYLETRIGLDAGRRAALRDALLE